MKGILVVVTAFVLLPGSVFMLLAVNFGALKGYLIAATAFFGFLALLSAVTGFCTGCELYKLLARFRGVRAGTVGAVDLAGLGAPAAGVVVVQFTHPLCSDCHELERRLLPAALPQQVVERREEDGARLPVVAAHRFLAVKNQIDHYLLDLHSIYQHQRQAI